MSNPENMLKPKAVRNSTAINKRVSVRAQKKIKNGFDEVQKQKPLERHQLRSGAIRREKTRQQLLRAAVHVFAVKGPDQAVIDDFIAEAGISRGSFYNHFLTTAELLLALMAELNDEIFKEMDPLLQRFTGPAERVACGSRLYLEWAAHSPIFASFMHRVGTSRGAMGELARRYLGRDLEAGRKLGIFDYDDLAAAMDLLIGGSMQSIEAIHCGKGDLERALATLRMGLRGVGVPESEALRVCELPLPEITLPNSDILSQLMPDS